MLITASPVVHRNAMVRLVAQLALAASLASLAAAGPVAERGTFVTVPVAKKAGKVSAHDLVLREKARISSFKGAAASGTAPATNEGET